MSTEHRNPAAWSPGSKKDYSVPVGLGIMLLIYALLPEPKSRDIAIALNQGQPDPLIQAIGGGENLGNNPVPVAYHNNQIGITTPQEKVEGWWDDLDKKLYKSCFKVGEEAGKQNNLAAQKHIFSKVTFDKKGNQIIRDLFWCLHQYESNGLKSTQYQTALQNFYDHYNRTPYKRRVWMLGIIYWVLEQRYSPQDIQILKNNWFPGAGDFQTLYSQII